MILMCPILMCPVWSDIFCMYTWYILFETFFLQQLRSIPSNPLLFLNLPHVWSRSISDECTMVVSRWFFQGSLHYSHWRLKHCKSWTLNVWYICQHLPTKINHSWFMLDVIFHAGRWRWRGLWWMRDWWLNSMQNIGIFPREPPNQWEYWAPYAGPIPFPIGFWIGSRYGWLGVPVFCWAPWNFLLKTWCVGCSFVPLRIK